MNTELLYEVHQGFTDLWWGEFANNTHNLEKHHVTENVLSEEEITGLNKVIDEVVKRAVKDEKSHEYLGAWKNGRQESNPFNFFKENPIHQNENIEEWKGRVLQESKFSLLLSNVEGHSEELSSTVMKYVAPYIAKFGIPINGFNTSIVLGDYEWNPLGIHKGAKSGYTLQLNLGHSVKEVYTWDEVKTKELGFGGEGASDNFEEFISNYSFKHSFKRGEVFSMPSKFAHTEKINGFSISLIIGINRLTEKELINVLWFKLGNELFNKNFTGNKATILPAYQSENHSEYIKKLFKEVRHRNINTNQAIQDALRICYLEHKLSLASNNGFLTPPVIDDEVSFSDFNKTVVNASIQIANACKVLCYEENEHFYLFVRGRKLKVRSDDQVISFVKELNKGEFIEYTSIKEDFFNKWREESIFMFLHLLFKNKGVKLQSSK